MWQFILNGGAGQAMSYIYPGRTRYIASSTRMSMPLRVQLPFLILFSFLASNALSQDIDSILTNEPAAIPLINISLETENTRQTINRATGRLLSVNEISKVEEEYRQQSLNSPRRLTIMRHFEVLLPMH